MIEFLWFLEEVSKFPQKYTSNAFSITGKENYSTWMSLGLEY